MLDLGWSSDPEGGAAESLTNVVSLVGQGDSDGGQIEDGTVHLDPESVLFSFKGRGVSRSLSIATWNCACLFGGLPQNEEARGRVRGKMDRVVSMSNKYDVLFLQETHGTENDIATLQGVLPNHLIAGSVIILVLGELLLLFHPILSETMVVLGAKESSSVDERSLSTSSTTLVVMMVVAMARYLFVVCMLSLLGVFLRSVASLSVFVVIFPRTAVKSFAWGVI